MSSESYIRVVTFRCAQRTIIELPNSMKGFLLEGPIIPSGSQEIPGISRSPKFHHGVHKSLKSPYIQLCDSCSKLKYVYTKIHFIIILRSMYRFYWNLCSCLCNNFFLLTIIVPIHATYPDNLTFRLFVPIIILGELWTKSTIRHFITCLHINALFSNSLKLCTSLNVRDKILRSYKTTDKVIVFQYFVSRCPSFCVRHFSDFVVTLLLGTKKRKLRWRSERFYCCLSPSAFTDKFV